MSAHARHNRPRGSGGAYWTSYADIMAGLMLVFGLVMVFSIFQFSNQSEDLSEKEELLRVQQEDLDAKAIELDEQTAQLLAAQMLLQSQQITLDAQQATLDDQQTTLDSQSLLLAAIQLTLDEKQTELNLKDLELQGAQAQVSAAQLAILTQRQQLDALVGVRARIIENLSAEFRTADLDVAVDLQTGAITMKGAVLFDVNSSVLKPGGMELLNNLIPVYVRTLLAEGNRDFVGEIIIEGHADSDGDYWRNMKLSQDRALAVATYCMSDGFGGLSAEEQTMLRKILTANGRSNSNPIINADGTEDKDASRRVEIKFRLKEAEMIDEMRTIMEAAKQ